MQIEENSSLAEIKGIDNKSNETIRYCQNDLDSLFKLTNLTDCTIYLDGKMKALFINNVKNCKIYAGIIEGSTFFDKCVDCEFNITAHQVIKKFIFA